MNDSALDARFEAYLTRDDDTPTGGQFFEMMAEIERRRPVPLASSPVPALREAKAKS